MMHKCIIINGNKREEGICVSSNRKIFKLTLKALKEQNDKTAYQRLHTIFKVFSRIKYV